MRVNFGTLVLLTLSLCFSLVGSTAAYASEPVGTRTIAFITETIARSFWVSTVLGTVAVPDKTKADPIVGNRIITLVNQCPFPVWFGFSAGSVRSRLGTTTICHVDADCYSGALCVQTGTIKQCFWKNPLPANGNFMLAANGGNNSVSIPIYKNALNTAWTGAVAGRTNCTSAGCETADCGNGTGSCPESRGFFQPATQAEFALENLSSDFYDVESVNGTNIPIMMIPNIALSLRTKLDGCNNPYQCGNPGAPMPVTQLGKCTWNMVPPANDYKFVAKGGSVCTTNSNCTAPAVCGISYDPLRSPQLLKTCGKLLGYWNGNQICGINPNYGPPFNCSQALPSPQQNLTLTNLYACAPINSCYLNGAPNTCCGCVNWDQIGINVPAAPITQRCINSNPVWTSTIQPQLAWVKQACPTMYTYPYDDKSSTFTCEVMQNGINQINYTITFCPSGLTGGVKG